MGSPGVAHRQERSRCSLNHQLVIKGQDSQNAFVIAWRCQHSYLSISASLDPDFMTAKFQAACWLSKSTTWSWVSTAYGLWLPWGLHSCWTMYMAQTICFYLRHFSLEKLWRITSEYKNNNETTHFWNILEIVHNPYICFLFQCIQLKEEHY